jgi:hypothetical protein
MDSVVRQTGQHVELEAEWEAAFNLHCQQAQNLTLIFHWCASYRKVLLKSTREALKKFQELQPNKQQPKNAVTLLNFTHLFHDYDVSTQPVSVHLPLSRIISGLLLALPKHGLEWDCSEMTLEAKPTLLQLMETDGASASQNVASQRPISTLTNTCWPSRRLLPPNRAKPKKTESAERYSSQKSFPVSSSSCHWRDSRPALDR